MRLLNVEYECISSVLCQDEGETLALALDFAKRLFPGAKVALTGDLGAGKTTWVRGVAAHFDLAEEVHSPSYALLHVYAKGKDTLRHFDLYRLSTGEGLEEIGLEEDESQNSMTFIEWPERLPQGWRFDLWVHLQMAPLEARQIHFYQCKRP